jgi:hypothetical protein
MLVGLAVVIGVPAGVMTLAGLSAAALLVAAEAPAITYPFVAPAGVVALIAAQRVKGDGMEGCNRMLGTVAGVYILAWSGFAFVLTGGPAALPQELASLRVLQPPLAALPFAAFVATLTRKERRAKVVVGTFLLFTAYAALIFFPVESGFAAAWPPRSDWLRFPLAGAAVALVPLLLKLAAVPGKTPLKRARERRDAARTAVPLLLAAAATGLAWAAARALLRALA